MTKIRTRTAESAHPRAEVVLRLYTRDVAPCFKTASDRARALGISVTAIRKWDRGELSFVKRASADRVLILSTTCQRLGPRFGRSRDVGDYLLHEVFEANRRIRPLDLVIATRNPEVAVELLDAARKATASVAKKRLPAAVFNESAWASILVPRSPDEQALEDELIKSDEEHEIPNVL